MQILNFRGFFKQYSDHYTPKYLFLEENLLNTVILNVILVKKTFIIACLICVYIIV